MTTTRPPLFAKKTAANNVYTGRRAPQLMNGFSSTAIRRSRRFSSVRVARMPGTLHPKPTSMGMNALPGRPMRRSDRSMTKAARAM